jgi:hypothetical protein
MWMSQARKQPRLQDFLTKTKTRARLIINPNHETRKTTTQHMQNKNSTRFYYNKAMTRKRTQIGVEQSKGEGEFYLYLYLLDT